jgi:hypothetical protein
MVFERSRFYLSWITLLLYQAKPAFVLSERGSASETMNARKRFRCYINSGGCGRFSDSSW